MIRMPVAPETASVAGHHVPSSGPRPRSSPGSGGERAGSGSAARTLPPDLLAEAGRRLGWVALVYAGGELVGHFGRRLLLAASGALDLSFRASDLLGLSAVAMGVAVYVLSRSRVSPRRLLDISLAFDVLGALGIAAIPIVDRLPQIPPGFFVYVPAECVWIVVFPLIVPNTPGRILVASLLAASMGPLLGILDAAFGGTPIEHPLEYATNFLTANYLCAVVAYLVARVIYGFGMQMTQLREIGSYELLERIGEGGMGEVWRARHRLLARPAAIKLIRADVLGSSSRMRDAFIRRFEREARETARLGSTHTIDVYDFGVTENGDFYYVMELLEGISLERYIRLFGPMEPARVIYVLRQVLHSLGEAHARGLVHRDVKPANIMLCRLGPDDDFVKVLDFGLVKHADTSETLLTKEGSTAGTPAYMAPEIALGRGDADGRADLYSLGCVAYFLVTGHPVFAADSDVGVALAHVKDEPVRPSLRSEFDIPPGLETVILDCLAKTPAARPSSAEEVDRRLADIKATNPWTREKAHAWWDLHHVSLLQPESPAPDAGSDAAGAGEPGARRCWPRLDRHHISSATPEP
jgi:serine/threonine protein kinase